MSVVPSGFTEQTFSAPGVSIHYLEGPENGRALVLLHGTARDWKSFSVLLPELARRFHIYVLDLRGHGSSGRVANGYGIFHYASDVCAFLSNVVPRGAAVFGHSLGGMVGLAVAAQTESKVSALILGDSMISPEKLADSIYHSIFVQLHALLLRGGSQQELARGIGKIELRLRGFSEPLRIEELPGNDESVLMEWARSAALTDPDVLAMTLDGTAYQGWNTEQLLPKVRCPALLLQGNPELDGLLSDEDLAKARRLLPNVKDAKFPLLGHALFMQQPKPVLNEVVRFLNGL